MTTDTSERGLENLIVSALTGLPLGAGLGSPDHAAYLPESYGGLGYKIGFSQDYEREYAVDLHRLCEPIIINSAIVAAPRLIELLKEVSYQADHRCGHRQAGRTGL